MRLLETRVFQVVVCGPQQHAYLAPPALAQTMVVLQRLSSNGRKSSSQHIQTLALWSVRSTYALVKRLR
jgi:hypothetical protein